MDDESQLYSYSRSNSVYLLFFFLLHLFAHVCAELCLRSIYLDWWFSQTLWLAIYTVANLLFCPHYHFHAVGNTFIRSHWCVAVWTFPALNRWTLNFPIVPLSLREKLQVCVMCLPSTLVNDKLYNHRTMIKMTKLKLLLWCLIMRHQDQFNVPLCSCCEPPCSLCAIENALGHVTEDERLFRIRPEKGLRGNPTVTTPNAVFCVHHLCTYVLICVFILLHKGLYGLCFFQSEVAWASLCGAYQVVRAFSIGQTVIGRKLHFNHGRQIVYV